MRQLCFSLLHIHPCLYRLSYLLLTLFFPSFSPLPPLLPRSHLTPSLPPPSLLPLFLPLSSLSPPSFLPPTSLCSSLLPSSLPSHLPYPSSPTMQSCTHSQSHCQPAQKSYYRAPRCHQASPAPHQQRDVPQTANRSKKKGNVSWHNTSHQPC